MPRITSVPVRHRRDADGLPAVQLDQRLLLRTVGEQPQSALERCPRATHSSDLIDAQLTRALRLAQQRYQGRRVGSR